MRCAVASSPSVSISICAALIAAMGQATFWPVYLGALPPIGSNMETPWGLMLPPAAMPMPPWIMAPRSVMMSPNMFSTTITSNHSGFFTNHMQVASTWAYSRREAAHAAVQPLRVLAHDREVEVRRPLVLEGAVHTGVELHGAQVDVLVQLE